MIYSRMLRLPGALLGTLTLFLSGCVSPDRIHTGTAQSTMTGVTGMVGLHQQELKTNIVRQDSSAMSGQFGLIGSLVGSAIDAGVNSKRAKEAEAAAGRLRDALLDYAPTERLTAMLTSHFQPAASSAKPAFVVLKVGSPDEPRNYIEAAGIDRVMFIDFDYALAPTYNGVILSAMVTLHASKNGKAATGAASKLPPVIYQNIISSVRYFPSLEGATLGAKAEELLTARGAMVREALDRAQEDIAALIIYDLDVPARPENALYKSDAEKRSLMPNRFNQGIFLGYIERIEGSRAWIRSIRGDLGADTL